jgi:tetratricopeptide (TPR) repeat protein
LGSAFKDLGRTDDGIKAYQRAISLNPSFHIALANLANVFKDIGRVPESINLYKRALAVNPGFTEAFCNLVNSQLFVCDWSDREHNLQSIKRIVDTQLSNGGIPTVLPFHTFTYTSLTSRQVREISRRNASKVLENLDAMMVPAGGYPIPEVYPLNDSLTARFASDTCLRIFPTIHYRI